MTAGAERADARDRSVSKPPNYFEKFRTLVKHQVGAAITTGVDFGTMIALVHFVDLAPTRATAIAAFTGALVNFTLGRRWIFAEAKPHSSRIGWQAARYGAVSLVSLILNTSGVYLLHDVGNIQYIVARAIVAIAVSLAWNYPMHRRFVFSNAQKTVTP